MSRQWDLPDPERKAQLAMLSPLVRELGERLVAFAAATA